MRTISCALVVLSAVACKKTEPAPTPPPTVPANVVGSAAAPAAPPPVAATPKVPAQVEKLVQLGKDKLAELRKSQPSEPASEASEHTISALGACTRPTEAEVATLTKTLTGFVTKSIPKGGKADAANFNFGCVEKNGVVVDAQVDFLDAAGQPTAGHWWTLRVNGEKIATLDHVTGPAQSTWMEWVGEKSLFTIVLVDLDKDGLLDVVSNRELHEGGSPLADFELKLFPTAKPAAIALGKDNSTGISVTALQPGLADGVLSLLFMGKIKNIAGCVKLAPGLKPCPSSDAALAIEQQMEAAVTLSELKSISDREEIAAALTTLGIAADKQADWLPAAAK
jgi:hypothetical protein